MTGNQIYAGNRTPFDASRYVEMAYRRFKREVYYDNSKLYLRIKIASFEASPEFRSRLATLAEQLNNHLSGDAQLCAKSNEYFDRITSTVKAKISPKAFESQKDDLTEKSSWSTRGFSNKSNSEPQKIKSILRLIDAEIEVFLISMMWASEFSPYIYDKTKDRCYAFRPAVTKNRKMTAWKASLFEPYFKQYTKWRDLALDRAIALHKSGVDTAIVCLDIRKFFDSADIPSLERIIEEVCPEANQSSQEKDILTLITSLLDKIHHSYSAKLGEKNIVLPVGLSSSGPIANCILHELDIKLEKSCDVSYYGRYVDDIMIVLSGAKFSSMKETESAVEQLLKEAGLDVKPNSAARPGTIESGESAADVSWTASFSGKFGNYEIQDAKTKIFHFSKQRSIKLLSDFKAKINLSSSEFRLAPNLRVSLEELENSTSRISQDQAGPAKFRTTRGFETSKFGISKSLSQILICLRDESSSTSKIASRTKRVIEEFSEGAQVITNYAVWEKIVSFFVLSDDSQGLVSFVSKCIESIDRIESGTNGISSAMTADSQAFLIEHLSLCISMSYTLSKPSLKKGTLSRPVWNFRSFDDPKNWSSLGLIKSSRKNGEFFRKSNLCRHHLFRVPLLNYFGYSNASIYQVMENISTLNKIGVQPNSSDFRTKYSPRWVQFDEVQEFITILLLAKKMQDSGHSFDAIELTKNWFFKFNRIPKSIKTRLKIPELKRSVSSSRSGSAHYEIEVGSSLNSPPSNFRVSICSMSVSFKDCIKSLMGTPNLSAEREESFSNLLNIFRDQKTKLAVLPEISVPLAWIPKAVRFSRVNAMGLVFGIEHFRIGDKVATNVLCVVLPFQSNGRSSAFVHFRPKHAPAPSEESSIRSLGFDIYKGANHQYIYHWQGISFAAFNCFELADISERSTLQGKVDLVAAVEYNPDIEYFSNIGESTTRELHCFLAQSNCSMYGDSRIIAPLESKLRDLARVKAKTGNVAIPADLSIWMLRAFQSGGHLMAEVVPGENISFKPLPPRFEMSHRRKNSLLVKSKE